MAEPVARTLMLLEAVEAPLAAERQLARYPAILPDLVARLRARPPAMAITCARGSSDHAATFARYLIGTRTGLPVASYAPSLSSIYRATPRGMEDALFLVISQSGRSPDLLLSARAAREAGALVVALVNDEASPLAGIAEFVIPLLAGPERSVAATKSFVASLLAIGHLVAGWLDDRDLADALHAAPAALRAALDEDWSPALGLLAPASSAFVIGRGLHLAIAEEAALKLKETCAIHAEAFSAAEVEHGPMAIAGAGFPVLMLRPAGAAGEGFPALARAFVGRGAEVVATGPAVDGVASLPTVPGLHPAIEPAVTILSFYALAARLSLARGLDPDRPPHLRKVTVTR